MNDYVTFDEAREMLGVAKSTLSLMIKDGRLTPHERQADRRRRYFKREEIEALRQPRAITPTGAVRRAS